MSGRTGSCPSCGAPIEFRNAATVTVVCASCGGASVRAGLDLEKIGKIAEVTPLDSLLDIGFTGRFEGKGWTAVGQVQLDHGSGPWNEWCLLLGDGSWGWLAEAQGELLFTKPSKPGPVPPHDRLRPGDAVDLGEAGHYVVAEVGKATVTAVRGELPFRVAAGEPRLYADLRKGASGFATLDYGGDDACDAVYLGVSVAPQDVGLDPSRAPAPPERRAAADRIRCPKCGGEIRLRDPEGAVRVGCASCGSVLDPTDPRAGILGKAATVRSAPRIPLGSKGKLRGVEVEVIAFLVRSVTVGYVRYPWGEYLLRVKAGRYRWLSESKGHWMVLEPVSVGEVQWHGGAVSFRGRPFKHFQGGDALVDAVYGEVYWEVRVGERVRSNDYVAGPECLSLEGDGKEQNATHGSHAERAEIEEVFGLKGKLPDLVGVGMVQPNPHRGTVWKWWLLAGGCAAVELAGAYLWKGDASESASFPCCLFLPLLLMPAIVQSTRAWNFEVARWSESDHPMSSSGDD